MSRFGRRFPIKAHTTGNRLLYVRPVATFMETADAIYSSGFAAGATYGFWSNGSGTVTTVTDFVHSPHTKSTAYAAGSSSKRYTHNAILSDRGSRISLYIYLNALPTTSTANLFEIVQASFANYVVNVKITTAGVLQLWNSNTTAQIGSDGSTLSTGVWYRLCLAYQINSTSQNEFRLYVGTVGNNYTPTSADISVSNATLARTGSSVFVVGNESGNAALDMRSDDHYCDNIPTLADTGNILITPKRPNANGSANDFTLQIGSGGSGYGSGHSPQVNERIYSTSNGWSVVNAGSVITEAYNIESLSAGDTDISTATIVNTFGWLMGKSLTSETAVLILNGSGYSIPLTTSIALFYTGVSLPTYPSGAGLDIGMQTDATVTTVSLYECGVLVAYIPGPTVTTSNGNFFRFFM